MGEIPKSYVVPPQTPGKEISVSSRVPSSGQSSTRKRSSTSTLHSPETSRWSFGVAVLSFIEQRAITKSRRTPPKSLKDHLTTATAPISDPARKWSELLWGFEMRPTAFLGDTSNGRQLNVLPFICSVRIRWSTGPYATLDLKQITGTFEK